MNKIVLLAFAVIGIAVIGCKPSTSNTYTNTNTNAPVHTTKEIEDKCMAAVKAHLTKMSEATGASLDTISLVKLDSATEKMGRQNYCRILEEFKTIQDQFVEMQKITVEAARKVHPSMAAAELARLNDAQEKQKEADAELKKYMADANTVDSVNYVYYRVTTFGTRTSPHGKDTLTGPYFINKDFTIKLF